MPENVESSPPSVGKPLSQSQRWAAMLQSLDPVVAPLLLKDPPVVDALWKGFLKEPSDLSVSKPSTPYWYFYLDLSTISCGCRGFQTLEALAESVTAMLKGNDLFFVMPFVGRPLNMLSGDGQVTIEDLDAKSIVKASASGLVARQAHPNDDSFIDSDYLLVPANAPAAIPVMREPRKSKPRKHTP